MAFQKIEDLPQDVRDQLLDGSQQIFMAAVNSAESDGLSEQAARNVAWNSVKQYYQKEGDGKWHRKPQLSNHTGSTFPLGGS